MKQFSRVLKFELKTHFTNKVFVGVTIFLVAAIAIVTFIPRILDAADGGDGGEEIASSGEVMLIKADGSGESDVFAEYFRAAFPEYDVKLTSESSDAIKEKIVSGEAECAFVMTGPAEYTYYVDNLSMYDVNTRIADEVLRDVYRVNAMMQTGLSEEEAAGIMNIGITGTTESLGKDQAENFLYTYIMIFALYMVILVYGQMITTNVATEKSSRAMELLITSVKPTAMMFGKVLASCIAGFVQLALIFGSALVFYNINKPYFGDIPMLGSVFDIPPSLLVYMLVFFVLGFLIYAFLFGAVASTVSKLEDVNTVSMPIMFMFVITFLIVMMSLTSGSVDTTLMKVCSFIPFTSPMAMFTRIAMSTVQWYEIAASVAILIASTVGVGVFAAKIYRAGVLMYGTAPKLGNVIRSVFKA